MNPPLPPVPRQRPTPFLLAALVLLALLAGCASPAQPAAPTPTQPPAPSALAPTPTARPATATAVRRPTSTPLPTAPAFYTVAINPAQAYQTLDGFGANSYAFPYADDLGWNWDAVKFVFDELDLAYIRLAPWLGWWETANDNADPYSIDWKGFGTVHDIINQHDVPFAQYLHERGIELSLGVWDFGGVGAYCDTCTDWLAAGSPRAIPPELYPEMGESIAAYILNMEKNGVPIAFTEVQNEPDIQAGIQYTPEGLRDGGKVLIEILDHYGLERVMLHAPNLHSPSGNVPWIDAWMAGEGLRERTAAVSYHTWWSEDPTAYNAIWEAAQKYDLPVWATEAGYSGSATSIDPQNWLTAFGFAESYYRAIAWSHAGRVYHWALLGNDALVGPQGEKYAMFYAVKHFANFIPAGARLVDSQSDDRRLHTLAFALPDGGFTVILLNGSREDRPVQITGLDLALESAVTSSDQRYEVPLTPGEGGRLLLPPLSITSIRYPKP